MVLLLTHLAVAYLSVEEARDFAESVQAMFLFSSFRNSNSILWGHSIDELFRYREVYVSSFGYVTLLVGFFGLFLFNKRFFILTFLIFLCLFQYNGISLVYIFMPIPGTTGIRFWYRLLFLMLPFITVGVVYAFSLLNVRSIFTYMLLALIVVEQIPIISYFAWSRSIEYWKIREYSRLLPASCKVVDIESTQGNSTFFIGF